MAQEHSTPERLRLIQDFASNWGKIVARRATDGQAPGTSLSFRDMEQIASAASLGLVQGTIQAFMEQHALQLGEQQPCPDCQRLCRVRLQQRTLAVEEGIVTFDEPFCHCPGCRRDFFPPPDFSTFGQPHLQSHPPSEDR